MVLEIHGGGVVVTIICYEHPLTVIYPLRKKGAYIHEGVMNQTTEGEKQINRSQQGENRVHPATFSS